MITCTECGKKLKLSEIEVTDTKNEWPNPLGVGGNVYHSICCGALVSDDSEVTDKYDHTILDWI